MKKKHWISSVLIAGSITPFMTTLSGCSHVGLFNKEAEIIKAAAIDEFINLCSVPHPTFGTRKICDYLKNFLISIGYSEASTLDDLTGDLKFYEDDYRATVYQVENSSGNLLFDIPATLGWESKQGVVLQAHMDMVVDGISPLEILDRHVVPIIDGNIIHSEGYETSLGADDGAGVGIILALVKNPNIIPHGPIRCIITADEEDGISGASCIDYLGLKYNYLINLDSENTKEITVSAAGTSDSILKVVNFKDDFVEEIDKGSTKQYKIEVTGLLGGHSAADINKNRGSAIQLIADIVNWVKLLTPSDGKFNLISMNSANPSNAIAKQAVATFATTLPYEADHQICIKKVIDWRIGLFNQMHPNEENVSVTCDKIPPSSEADRGLTVAGSRNTLEMILACLFGPISWIDPEKKEVETSNNLSNLDLDLKRVGEQDNPQFHLENLARSTYNFELEGLDNYFIQLGGDYLEEMIQGETATYELLSKTQPWEVIEDQDFRELSLSAFKNAGKNDTNIVNCHGWLEPGNFFLAYKQAGVEGHMISIGADVDDPHTRRETLHLNTYKVLIQTTLYIINKINDII